MALFAAGLGLPEGPLLLSDGTWLVTEMAPERGCITRISATASHRSVVAHTGRPNGLAHEKDGAVLVAESSRREVLRVGFDGDCETVSTSADGSRYLWPNDVCIGPDGAAYLTDSGMLVADFRDDIPLASASPAEGRVCRVDLSTGKATNVDAGLRFPNGIAFGPDDMLYVSETATGNVYRYRTAGDRVADERELFGNVLDESRESAAVVGPDGIAFDASGLLYVAVYGQRCVAVLDSSGACVRRVETAGRLPTNVAFGPPGSHSLFVVEVELGQMERFDVATDGLPLHSTAA